LKAKANVWEKEDLQKTKKVLVLELVQTQKNEHTLDFNCKVWEQSQKKTVANFKAYKAKVEPQLKELRQLRAQMGENSDQAEQVRTLQNNLEFWKMQCDKMKAALVLAQTKNDNLVIMAKKAKSEASAARV
jgi:esterase/lipase